MDITKIEDIHKKYSDHMQDYQLIGSYSIYIPFYKTAMRMLYTYETGLDIIEEFICRCLESGIKEKSKIIYVLAIDEEIFQSAISELIKDKYLEMNVDEKKEDILTLTDKGRKLYAKKAKHEARSHESVWFYDALSGEYSDLFYSNEQEHIFKKKKDVPEENKHLVFGSEASPSYVKERDYNMLSKMVLDNLGIEDQGNDTWISTKNIVTIEDFQIIRSTSEKLYHEYRILIYKNSSEQYMLLAHDPCGLDFIDNRVTESISKFYKQGRFRDIINNLDKFSESYGAVANIIKAVKGTEEVQFAKENYVVEEEDN